LNIPLINIFLFIGLLVGAGSSRTVARQTAIEFRNASVEGNYPDGVTFRVEICGRPASSRVVFNYSLAPESIETWSWFRNYQAVDEGQTSDDCDRRKFYLETNDLEIPPFSPIKYYWSVIENADVNIESEKAVYYYQDVSHDWKKMAEDGLIVWWHDRPDSFAQEVLSIANRAEKDQVAYYGMSLQSPITIVIANTTEEFYTWQEVQENIGGEAFSDMYLTIQLVPDEPGYYEWLGDVIPHEISHIYFNHLVKPYSGSPAWLNEGMASYLEYNNHDADWLIVRNGFQSGKLRSLQDLKFDFGKGADEINLVYAESYYAVLYMHEVYGADAVSKLLYEFSKGSGADAAFKKAFGRDAEGFAADFMSWLEDRVKTPPPGTQLQSSISKIQLSLIYRSLAAICLLPFCFLGIGAGGILVFWKLYQASQSKEKTISP
jgi:hypothetical protein